MLKCYYVRFLNIYIFLNVISIGSKGAWTIERNVLGMFNFLCSYIDPCMPVSFVEKFEINCI